MAASCLLLPATALERVEMLVHILLALQASLGLRKTDVLLSILVKYYSSASRSLSGCH